jgi:hypothetical protein
VATNAKVCPSGEIVSDVGSVVGGVLISTRISASGVVKGVTLERLIKIAAAIRTRTRADSQASRSFRDNDVLFPGMARG